MNQLEKLNLSGVKLKELRIFKSNVNVPASAVIISARANPRYEDGVAIADSIEKISLECVDAELAHSLKKLNADISQIKGFSVDFEGNAETLKKINLESLMSKEISLSEASLALKWVRRGQSGGYSELKLIVNKLVLAQQ